ncbi:MAG TPA: hypothetical protein VIA62_14570 [Thermoanaerobaculia bacterium]|jgi:hypothetical protein|nr:hypothetical protein [Thermoanaerobaculia bacterium]
MKTMKWMYVAAAAALLVASSASAQRIPAGDDGLSTQGGGRTQVDLAAYPIDKVFGAGVEGNSIVSLKGESLGTGALDGIDTIVRRPQDIDVSSGAGSGPLAIVALRLVSEQPVSIGGKSYTVHVFLSEFRDDVKAGRLDLQMVNADGGTFNSFFNVRPKLVFTGEDGNSTTIDCGAVVCGDGSDLRMSATNGSFTIGGVKDGFNPQQRQMKSLPAGLAVDGDGDGVAELRTLASTNLYIGIRPVRPTFPPDPTDKNEQSTNHRVVAASSASSSSAASKASPRTRVNGIHTPSSPEKQ